MSAVKPRLLDLFCGAGGCTKGFQRAGFYVVGVDLRPQPNYCGDEFIQADALEVLRLGIVAGPAALDYAGPVSGFAAIAASPPCQHDADVTAWRGTPDDHPDLILPTKELLIETGLPYVLENVRGAARKGKLRGDLMLCGSMFGLPIRRHRYFEMNWEMPWGVTNSCGHSPEDYSFDHGGKQPESVYRDAMGCEWMTVQESREAIPPAYTKHIGRFLKAEVEHRDGLEAAAA
jgi:DNA (cytosine-5)-methyltransferase 1